MGIKVEIDNRGLVQTKTADNEATQFLLYGVPVGSGGGTLNPMSFRKFDDSQAESIEEETLLFNVTSEDFGLDKVLWICPLAENPEVDRIVGLPIAQIGDVITISYNTDYFDFETLAEFEPMGILPFSISTETEAYTLILNAGVPLTSQRPILFGTTIKLVKMFDFVVFDTPVQVWQVLEEIKPSASSRPTQVPKHAFYPVESQYITLGSNYFSSLEDAIDYLHDNRTNVPGVLHLLEDLGVSSSLDMYGIEIRSEETNPRTIQFIEGGNIDGVAKFTNIVFGANELTSPPVTSYNTLYLENCIIPNSDLPLMEVTRVVASGLTEAGINAFAIPSWYEGSMTVTTYDNAVINPNAISTAFGLTFNVYDNSKASSIQSAGSISTNLFNPKANKRVAGYESNLTFFLNEEHDNQYTDINTQYNSCSIFVGALPPGFSWTGRKTHADNAVTFDAGEGNIIFYGQNTCTAIDTLIEISVGYNGEPMIRLTPPV